MPALTSSFQGEVYQREQLTEAEKAALLHGVYDLIAPHNATLIELYKQNQVNIIAAAEIAKAALGAQFGGMLPADSEFGVQPIRPAYIMRTTGTTETAETTWAFTFTSGNDNWIGFGTNNATAVNIDKRVCLLILGFAFTQGGSPIVEELFPTINGTQYPSIVIRHAWQADNYNQVRVCRSTPCVLAPKATTIWTANSIIAGVNELVPLGLAFVKGDIARTTGAPTVQT